jgi:hypothetical protein
MFPSPHDSKKIVAEHHPHAKHWLYFISVLGLLVAVVGYFYSIYESKELLPLQSIYFEITVIDGEGHPLGGATVSAKGKDLGVTDSFGEWRRFLRVHPGSTLSLHMEKMHQGTLLEVTKNLAIPRETFALKDMEIRTTIQLQPQSPSQNAVSAAKEPPAPVEPILTHQIWFAQLEGSKTQSTEITNKIQSLLTSLTSQAKKQGYEVDKKSLWQVALQWIPAQEPHHGSGLLRVISLQPGAKSPLDFLQPTIASSPTTAASILEKILAPELTLPGEESASHYIHIQGHNPSDLDVFVSGKKATYDPAEKGWKYTEPSFTKSFLTILHEGHVVYRKQILHQPGLPVDVSL